MIGLSAVEIAVPEGKLTLAEVLAAPGRSEQDLATIRALGIRELPVIRDEEGAHALAVTAARRLLARHGLAADRLDVLVHIPARVPEKLMASEVTRVQADLGASGATCLSTGDLGCASSSAALLIARSLLTANPGWHNALITHGSVAPTGDRYRRPVTLSGDAGVAALLTREPRYAIEDLRLRSDGRFWDLFAIDYLDRPRDAWIEACSSVRDYSFTLAVQSRNVLRDLTREVLGDAGGADHVVMQNLSSGAFGFYEQALGLKISPVCRDNLARYGHLGPADVLVNLGSLDALPGERVLVLNNSPSAAWSAALLRAG
ncbi:3-oxoacyl-ACP synthase [Nonomuraea monospora]|uniref:3-oxoacyl-ACP synthase n=1 Tax=Nonomuraea monospora TaxID=568818 RepID=A0ABN3CWF8_9ACTN